MTSEPSLAQDPRELFDVVRYDGSPAGFAKARADVHRDGDWHRALHVWIAGFGDEGPFLMFQQRSMRKDTLPGMLDATVGGHVRAGEDLSVTVREVEEEIGIAVTLEQLTWAGRRICVNEGEAGVIDHELQEVYFLRNDGDPTLYAPNRVEVEALVRFPLEDLLAYLAGDRTEVSGLVFTAGGASVTAATFGQDRLRHHGDRYFYRVAIAAGRFLEGERHIAV